VEVIMGTREIVAREVIDEWMTKDLLQRAPDFEGCQISLSYRLAEPDGDGCNWSDATLRLGPKVDARQAWPIANEIVCRARARFNLAEEPEPVEPAKPIMESNFERRLLYIPVFQIDTNLINAKQKLDAVNRLEQWAEDGVILINMSWTAHAEAQADGNPERVRKASQQLFTIDTGEADGALAAKVGDVLFPGGPKDDNQRNDVRIVCEAIKWHATLVTMDGASKSQPGGILGNRDKLRTMSDILIMSPDEAVGFVETKIRARDDLNKRIARAMGAEPPDWTGED
jgi:hypothetical protein